MYCAADVAPLMGVASRVADAAIHVDGSGVPVAAGAGPGWAAALLATARLAARLVALLPTAPPRPIYAFPCLPPPVAVNLVGTTAQMLFHQCARLPPAVAAALLAPARVRRLLEGSAPATGDALPPAGAGHWMSFHAVAVALVGVAVELAVVMNGMSAAAGRSPRRSPAASPASTGGAVPEVRLSYWNDPNYRTGRVKGSRKGLFERNGCTGSDIYTHPHFLEHLRYFLFGTELPDPVVKEFEEKVGNPEWVSSSDIVPIGKAARELTRRYRLDIANAPEEFFKLCLDMGLGLSTAESVMRSVKQVR